METPTNRSQPTPEEARIALLAAQAEEQATVNRPVPVWFYPVLAAMIFVLMALNSIDASTGTIKAITVVATLVLAVGIGGLVGAVNVDQPGYKRIHVPWGQTILMTLVAGAFPVAAIALDDTIGSWVWIASGGVLALLILTTGVSYQRKHRND